MLTLNSASKDGLVFMVLWLLAQTLASVSSIEIIRSSNDKVLFGKDYHKMVNLTDNRTMNCDGSQSCQCNMRDGYNTVIYNKTTNFIKCVKDKDEAMDMNADDGHYLTTNNGKCLGVSKQKIYKTSCTNDLSLRWIYFGFLHILNLKTLKCLEWNYNSKEFTTAQCKSDKEEQHWSHKDEKIILNGKKVNITKPLKSSLFSNGGGRSYKGCYRASGDKMIGVIKRSHECEDVPQRKCKIAINVNAPIMHQRDSTCKIIWEISTYTSLGETWNPFSSIDQGLLELNRINEETITLNTNDSDTFFERWGGTLIKLHIKCGNEQHCTILKIATMEYAKNPSTAKALLPTLISNTVNSTLSVEGRSKMSSMLFIIPVVVILCLLIVVLVIVVYYRRRQKRSASKEDIHLYEETTGGDVKTTNYEEPGELIKTQPPTANPYESPGKTIHVGSLYENPTYSISQQDSVKIPPKNNNFQYDYATREEDSVLPLILNGDVVFEDGKPGSQSLREKRDCHAGQPHPQPFYHTLDEDISGTDKNSLEQPKSCEKHDSHAKLPHEKAIYHTLEEDTSLTDNDASKPSNTHDKKPLYHILEKDTSDSGKEVNTKRKNSREQPFYNTLENDYEEI